MYYPRLMLEMTAPVLELYSGARIEHTVVMYYPRLLMLEMTAPGLELLRCSNYSGVVITVVITAR